ncbi:helix-turn-helix transcriptional regulator [Dongshaea marina]|uniref:helix-turn-helix transcriptional regulator n=1 Tax=Dongshaea marina TaxID=2047966 RepID=UPI000D3E3560|nr:hypothetical protein [Dongshaea marina]
MKLDSNYLSFRQARHFSDLIRQSASDIEASHVCYTYLSQDKGIQVMGTDPRWIHSYFDADLQENMASRISDGVNLWHHCDHLTAELLLAKKHGIYKLDFPRLRQGGSGEILSFAFSEPPSNVPGLYRLLSLLNELSQHALKLRLSHRGRCFIEPYSRLEICDERERLQPAEKQLVLYLIEGYSTAQIASAEGSSRTVIEHQLRLLERKCGAPVSPRERFVEAVFSRGLLEL